MFPHQPGVKFYRAFEGAPLPVRADRSGYGTLPIRAARYCDAVTLASAYGWWVFPPIDFELLWDGRSVFWKYGDVEPWMPLEAAQFPNFAQTFDSVAPDDIRGYSPPFLTALPEPGYVQIWSGMLARTTPDWSLLTRAPANLPLAGGFESFEGIIEYDRWFGPLFTNIRLTRTNLPVCLNTATPLIQVQPLHRAIYSDATMEAMGTVNRLEDFRDSDWADYRQTIVTPNQRPSPPGSYAAAARQRRKREQVPESS